MISSEKILLAIAIIVAILLMLIQKKAKQQQQIFTTADYSSSDGMMTAVWGPAAWHFLHTISFNYPTNPTDQQKEQYKEFFTSLQNVLPCKYCRDNYKSNLEILPLSGNVMANRDTFSRWLFDLHQLVNERLNKKVEINYEQVRATYENFRSRCVTQSDVIEKGCTVPFYGKKAKCVVNIVPSDINTPSFIMDPQCYLRK